MPTKAHTITVDQDVSTKSLGLSLDEAGKPTKFIFDVDLSTAIAANGQPHATSRLPRVRLRRRCWTR